MIQVFADARDAKNFYDAINSVYGPRQTNTAPLKSKDGKIEINERLLEHFADLLNCPNTIKNETINSFPQMPVRAELFKSKSVDGRDLFRDHSN